ncbi:MAG: hypothetical protein A07HR60_00619 [uncultured archaeon A07HR60]|nr:MAG: hypothetical protein A07HR60_00619 [uncultured archaeon A07HR60]
MAPLSETSGAAVAQFHFHPAWLGYKPSLLGVFCMQSQQQSSVDSAPQFTSPTRVEVTECRTERLPTRVQANNVDGATVYLERRGGRTFLVADPHE